MLKLAYKSGAAVVQRLARLPGTLEIRGSSPGRGMTDFLYVNIHLFILMPVSYTPNILNVYIYIYIFFFKTM